MNKTIWKTGDQIVFDGNQSSDPDGNITYFTWNFGDGSAEIIGANRGIVEHNYTEAGHFTVNLTVKDEAGAVNKTSIILAITREDASVSINQVLMSRENPLIPANQTFSFEIEKDAKSVNITLQLSGYTFSVDIQVLNPLGTLLDNKTVKKDSPLSGDSGSVSFLLIESSLKRIGAYQIEVSCSEGSSYISGEIEVFY